MDAGEIYEETHEPSGVLAEAMRQRALDEFGEDGAWLLMSTFLYGWRSYYDLGLATVAGGGPRRHPDDGVPFDVSHEFEIVVSLQVQSLLVSAAEQFFTLLLAAHDHTTGAAPFFDSAMQFRTLERLASQAAALEEPEVARLLGIPITADEIEKARDHAPETPAPPITEGVDPVIAMAVTAEPVGKLYAPRGALRNAAHEEMARRVNLLAGDLVTCVAQLQALTELEAERPELQDSGDLLVAAESSDGLPRPQPLKAVDNAFRHGHRVLFREAVPVQRTFRAYRAPAQPRGTHPVDLYLPHGQDRVRFASVDAGPSHAVDNLRSLKNLSLWTARLLRGFLWSTLYRSPAGLVTALSLDLADLDAEETPE